MSARTETTLATGSYEVGGDPRLSASIAATGQGAPASGFGKAAQAVFGNLELLVGVLLLLVGLMTVGATTAAFAGAVHARKRTLGIHRAVGASPWQVLRIVLADAAVVGIVATGLGLMGAVGALWILDAADLLTVYGVRLVSMLSMRAVLAPASIALVLAITGAIGATWRILRTSPSDLLGARQIDTPPEKKDNQQSPHSAGDPSPEQRTHQGDQTQGEEGEDA